MMINRSRSADQASNQHTLRIIVATSLLAIGCLALNANAQIPGDSLVLEGDYIRTGVSNNGTLGVGGNTSPGYIFDATGTGDFNTANDYLTPGSPHEGFSVRHDGSGIYVNNNTGTIQIGPAAAPTAVGSGTSGFDNSVTWSGSVAGEFNITHDYGLNNDAKQVEISTTITALSDLTGLRFSRWIDPDSGGTSSINTRGNAALGLAPENWVNSESETNGATLGIYSNDPATHNTGIDPGWSTDPDFYIAGTGDTVGDHTIGMGFSLGDLLTGESITFVYLYAVSADADDFDLGGGYAPRAMTLNQMRLAEYLDMLGGDTPAGLAAALDVVSPLSDPEFQAALNQLDGALYGSISNVNLQHTSYYLSHIATRFRSHMQPGQPLSSSGFVDTTPVVTPVMLVSYEQPCSCGRTPRSCCPKRGGWIAGYGLGGQADSDGNADGFEYGLGGTQFAVERAFSRNWMGGIWGNIAWGNVDGRNLNERASLENHHFGGHLVGFDGCDYWIALAGAGVNTAEVNRTISSGALSQTAHGDVAGMQTNVYLERGRSVCWQGMWVQPFAALQYVYQFQDNFTETGAGALNLVVDDVHSHSLRSVLGARVSRSYRTRRDRLVSPELRGSWMHEFLDSNQAFNSAFVGTTGSFVVDGVDLGRDWANVGGGVSLQLGANSRLFSGYDAQFNDHQVWHVGSGGFEAVW